MAIVIGFTAGEAVQAQDSGATQKLETVTVTATKRAMNIEDIPMSIQAVSGDDLTKQGTTDFYGLSQSIPNFSVGQGLSNPQIAMRGMSSGNNRGFEQSVAMFVDGIYMPKGHQYIAPFLDVQRIEVLRGPQAVLFGLNATAGSVSVISAKTRPGDKPVAELTGEYEARYGGWNNTVVVGGSPSESLGLRLAYNQRDTGKGYTFNSFTGGHDGAIKSDNIRLTAVWSPIADLTITPSFSHLEYRSPGSYGEIFGKNSTMFDPGDGRLNWQHSTDAKYLSLVYDKPPGQYLRSDNFVVNVDYQVGENTLTLLLGNSTFKYSTGLDLDTSSTNVGFSADSSAHEAYAQKSAELRWASAAGREFEYVGGVYYLRSEYDTNIRSVLVVNAAAGAAPYSSADIKSNLWSAFGSGTWRFADGFRLIGGARYTHDSRSFSGTNTCPGVANGVIAATDLWQTPLRSLCSLPQFRPDQSRPASNLMPEVVLQWDANTDTMLYGKVGTSAKAGGFAGAGQRFEDEKVTGLELGLKAKVLGGSALINVTAFRNDFKDMQVSSYSNDLPPATVINNAGKARTQGLEVDGRWLATPWLTLAGSVAYLDARFTDFPRGPCPVGVAVPCDLAGKTLPFAPRVTASAGAEVNVPVSDRLRIVGGVNLNYSASYFADGSLDPNALQGAYTKVGARLGVEPADRRWSVSLIGQNLSNKAVLGTAQPLSGRWIGYIGAPRTVTLQAKYRL